MSLDPRAVAEEFPNEGGVAVEEGEGGEQGRMVVVGEGQDIKGKIESPVSKG